MYSPQAARTGRDDYALNGSFPDMMKGRPDTLTGRNNESSRTPRARKPATAAASAQPAAQGVGRNARNGNGNGQKTAADLDRDARAGFEAMRDLLKNQPPWSRDVELYRQKTRNLHQTLLFNHPLHPLAQSLDPMWIRTTYSLIVSFRDHVARGEGALSASTGSGNRRAQQNSPAEQELRKVLTRFRQALASEEGFYRQLVVRLVRFFGMEEMCQSALAGVGLSLSGGKMEDGEGGNGKSSPDLSQEEKKDKIALVYKALVCLGDIERYKEQYSDGYRRIKAGGSRQRKGDEVEEQFGRAKAYYDVARALTPEDGSAFNQLAVISTYLNDDFSTIYNYVRALAIKVPFKGISDILDRYLKKAFERWLERKQETEAAVPTVGLEEFTREVGVVVAVTFRQNGFSQYGALKSSIIPGLSTLLCSRSLPSETIVRLTVVTIGLHWHTRSLASVIPGPNDHTTTSPSRTQQAEDTALDFLLCTFIVLLTISASEIEEVMKAPGWSNPADSAIAEDDEDESGSPLHASISAALRRILPSLRIISKWAKLHLDYLSRIPPSGSPTPTSLDVSVPTFWSAYYRLIEDLARVFPLGMLPSLEAGLEEDEDMRGFLPIARGLLRSKPSGLAADGEVHPNEEQLMRIADLQVDATLILQAQTSGYTQIPEPEAEMVYSNYVDTDLKGDEDYASVSTETEDDPVNMAMRASLGSSSTPGFDDGDGDDQMGEWDQGYPAGNVQAQTNPQAHAGNPTPTAHDLLQNLVLDNPTATPNPPYANPYAQQPSSAKRNSASFARGALPSPRSAPLPPSGSGSPGLLFGGEGIWSMTREESNSQKGLKRDGMPTSGDSGLSRPQSERPKARIGAEGVKAIWDTQAPGPSASVAASPFGVSDRRVSAGQAGPQAQAPAPMDAAQLFAGISGFGPPGGGAGFGAGMGMGSTWDVGAGGKQVDGQTWAAGQGSGLGQSQGQAQGQGGSGLWGGSGLGQQGQGGYGGYPTWG